MKIEFDSLSNELEKLHPGEEGIRGDLPQILTTIEDALPYGIWITDPEGKLIYVSRSFLDMVNMTFEDAQDFGWSEKLLPGTGEDTLKRWNECREKGGFWDVEHTFLACDGTERYVLARGYPVKDESGKIIYWFGINLDITEKRKAFLQLEAVTKDYSELLNRINDIFLSLDKDMKITFANRAAKIYIRDSSVEGKKISEVLPDFGTSNEEVFEHSFKTQKFDRVNYENETMGRTFDVKIYPHANGLTIFAADITEEKKAKDRLKQLVQEKELFLREVHHRMKNNFQLLLSMINLQSGNTQDPVMKAAFAETWNRINSLGLIYEQLFQRASITEVSIKQYVTDLIGSIAGSFLKGDDISFETDIQDVIVNNSIAVSLGLIINELVSNSLKYAFSLSEKGTVSVSISKINKTTIRIIVRDNGRGISWDDKTERPHSLGLTIIQALAEQHSGSFTIEKNNGTVATIELDLN